MDKSARRPGLVIASMAGLTITMAVLALVACGRKDQGLYAEHSTLVAAPVVSADAPPAYLGRWARSAAECARQPYVFEIRRITAPKGAWCEVSDWQTSPAGYGLTTVCHINGDDPTPGRLLVTVPDQARGRTMTVEGGPLDRPLGLVRCPTTEASAPTEAAG